MKLGWIGLFFFSTTALATTNYTCQNIGSENPRNPETVFLTIKGVNKVSLNGVDSKMVPSELSDAQFFDGYVGVKGKFESPFPGMPDVSLLLSDSLVAEEAKGTILLISELADGKSTSMFACSITL